MQLFPLIFLQFLPFYLFPPLCPCQLLAFSQFPPFFHANAKIVSPALGFEGFGNY